jgi:hypothetical protein
MTSGMNGPVVASVTLFTAFLVHGILPRSEFGSFDVAARAIASGLTAALTASALFVLGSDSDEASESSLAGVEEHVAAHH